MRRLVFPAAVEATVCDRAGVSVVAHRADGTFLAYVEDNVVGQLRSEGVAITAADDEDTIAARFDAAVRQTTDEFSAPALRGDLPVELMLGILKDIRTRLNALMFDMLASAQDLARVLRIDESPQLHQGLDKVVLAIGRFCTALESPYRAPTTALIDKSVAALAAAASDFERAFTVDGLIALLGNMFPTDAAAASLLGFLGLNSRPVRITAANGSITVTVPGSGVNVLGLLKAQSVTFTAVFHYANLDGSPLPTPTLGVDLAIQKLRLAPAETGPLLDAIGIGAAPVDLAVVLNSAGQLSFGGAAPGRHIRLVPPKSLGLIRIKSLDLDVVPMDGRLFVSITSSVQGGLGAPLALTADGLGVQLEIDPTGTQLVRTPKVLTPNGFGVQVEAGPVRGGGFVRWMAIPEHPDWTRYSGALFLRVGPVEVTAFAVLTERPSGVAFVAMISAEFFPPIELGLLFTLNGIGGIIGAGVTADTDALARGVGDGTISKLLFPPDPAAAAPTILDTLAAVFPWSSGGFVVGPMVKVGWGRPISFVTAELALILVLPDVKVLVLGKVRVALPAAAVPIIDLRAEVYGEFTADRVLILASLVQSRIGFFAIDGDLGLLMRLGDNPEFALSAGGFHPRYRPPPELAALQRISAEISPPTFHLRVEAYAAFTTNTVQFGGEVDIRYGIDGTGVYGRAALDALVRLDPFGFQADLLVAVSLRVLGASLISASLRLHLEGPAPWKAWGTGEVGLPWPLPDLSLDVGPITWGDPQPEAALTVSPRQLVIHALSQSGAWTATTTAGDYGVRFADGSDVPQVDGGALVDPWSALTGKQGVVPLDIEIARVGACRVPESERVISLADAFFDTGGGQLWRVKPREEVSDHFAPGQYLDLPDDQLLQRPSFEQLPAGLRVELSGSGLPAGSGQVGVVPHYVTSFPHDEASQRIDPVLASTGDITVSATAAGSSVLRDRYAVPTTPLVMAPADEMLVRSTEDLQAVAGAGRRALSWTLAEQVATEVVRKKPELAAIVQLVALGGA